MPGFRWLPILLAVLSLGLAPTCPAQDAAQPGLPTVEELEPKIAALEAEVAAGNTASQAQLDLLRQARDELRLADERARAAAEFDRLAREAPTSIEQIRAELAQPPLPPVAQVPEGATLSQLEQSLAQAEAALAAARQEMADLQIEPQRRQERRIAITDLLAKANQRRTQLDDQLATPPPADVGADVAAARRTLLTAQKLATQREIESLEKELAGLDSRRELLTARQDRAQRRAGEAEALVNAWRNTVQDRRAQDAERAAREAKQAARKLALQAPQVEAIARENERLAGLRTGPQGVTGAIDAKSRQLQDVRASLTRLRDSFRAVRRKVEAGGLTDAIGLLLRRQMSQIPDPDVIRARDRAIQRELSDAQYRLIDFQEQRSNAGDIDKLLSELVQSVPTSSESERVVLTEVGRELLTSRRDYLDALIADYEKLFETLAELETTTRALADAADEYESYIEERVLWVRSVGRSPDGFIAACRASVIWLTDAGAWQGAFRQTTSFATEQVGLLVLNVVAILLLAGVHPVCARELRRIAPLLGRYETDSFRLTIRAVVYTVIMALPVPGLLWSTGWWLGNSPEQGQLAIAAAAGFRRAAMLSLGLLLLLSILRPSGLAEAHFRWPASSLRLVRRNSRWVAIAIPLAFITASLDAQPDEILSDSLGRACFVLCMLLLSVFLQRTLRISGPVTGEFLKRHRGGWVDRLKWIWYPLVVGLPLALAITAVSGWFYTAYHLNRRLIASLNFVLLLVLVNALLQRWLYIARRRLAIDRLRQRREAEAAALAEPPKPGEESVRVEEAAVDIPAVSAQSRAIIHAGIAVATILGLAAIWADVLPALRALDRVEIWPHPRIVEARDGVIASPPEPSAAPSSAAQPSTAAPPAESASPSPSTPLTPLSVLPSGASNQSQAPPDASRPVTLTSVLGALAILFLTVVAARNVPGLLEIVLLQRLPIQSGGRYALKTTARYAIAIAGVLGATTLIGVPWSKVQWLVAALTFGLAFGLQEIFANFISGLILLGEQPLRVGDTVTVGDVTGVVSRIQMRATTIVDYDRKELIIPNKSFITDRFINWTLTDDTTRIVIPVGIAYGSDVELARRTLLRVAAENSTVLKEPKPVAVFRAFGDSTLNFELRVFLPNLDFLVTARDEILTAIDREFRKAGIEIAFPQRDLHVRTIGPLEELVRKPAPRDPAGP